jgi:predicted dinucleotide-binding enzyme
LITAIIGVGKIGSPLARHLVDGYERVVLASTHESRAQALAKAGGVAEAARIEMPGGDLHQFGGLNGELVDLERARAALAAREVAA